MRRWIKYAILLSLLTTAAPKKGCNSKKCNCPHFTAEKLTATPADMPVMLVR